MPRMRIERSRQKAAELRAMAANEADPKFRAELLWIAQEYDNLAKETEEQLSKGP